MMKRVVPLMMLALLGGLAPADTPPVCPSSADGVTCSSLSYTILISQKTAQSPDWQPVVTALLKKYPQAHVAELSELSESEIAAALRCGKARHAALIARPEEVNRVLFLNIHRASRQLDDDMWGDCICGVITGASPTDALRIAAASEPLVMKRLLATTNVDHTRFEHSYCITDWTGAPVREQSGYTEPSHILYSPETEEGKKVLTDGLQTLFAHQLETQRPQLIITSSHATQFNLEMPFSYGLIFPANGRYYQASPADMNEFRRVLGAAYRLRHDVAEQWVELKQKNPITPDGEARVWLAAGNCLFGDAYNTGNSMAATALSAYTCNQIVGYTVPSWYGEGGWGTMGSLLSNAEGTSLSEAWFINNQFLLNRTCEIDPRLLSIRFDEPEFFGRGQGKMLNAIMTARIPLKQETLKDSLGLIHDRDVVAFYGDPAWRAVVNEENTKPSFKVTWNNSSSFTISSEKGGKGRIGVLIPDSVDRDAVTGCDADDAIFTNDFILFKEVELAPGASRVVNLHFRAE